MTMGGMAWGMDVRKHDQEASDGGGVVHWDDYTPLLIAKPEPFRFRTLPRSQHKLHSMRGMFQAATGADWLVEERPGMAVGSFEPVPGGQGGLDWFEPDLGWRDENMAGSTSTGTDTPDESVAGSIQEAPSNLGQYGEIFGFKPRRYGLRAMKTRWRRMRRRRLEWAICG